MDESANTSSTPLNQGQVALIEKVHGGFLYQHLIAVGALLLAPAANVRQIRVERDEDVEIELSHLTRYLQVKTRSAPLIPYDIKGALTLGAKIRARAKEQEKSAEIRIICNVQPGPKLKKNLLAATWPDDTVLQPPGAKHPQDVPPAWETIAEALDWCEAQASKIPGTLLLPETLVAKLAARVMYACTGPTSQRSHQFNIDDLGTLFEQLFIQLHKCPEPPAHYYGATAAPQLDSELRVRTITGLSGSGKSAWIGEVARHVPGQFGYIDVSVLQGENLVPALVRELVAQTTREATPVLPGASALETLRAFEQVHEGPLTIVVDNANRASVDDIVTAVEVTSRIKWLLVGQPSERMAFWAAKFNAIPEQLPPLSNHDIATYFQAEGLPITPETAEKISRLTGGLPLFVKSAIRTCVESYNRDVEAMYLSLSQGLHEKVSLQELLLAESLKALSGQALQVAQCLNTSETLLSMSEASALVSGALKIQPRQAMNHLRAMKTAGILVGTTGQDVTIHDAYALSLHGLEVDESLVENSRRQLVAILKAAPSPGRPSRYVAFLRLLYELGEVEEFLAELANRSEYMYELGITKSLVPLVIQLAGEQSQDVTDRFWALDTLCFWALQDREEDVAEGHLEQMEEIHTSANLKQNAILALFLKRLILASRQGDADEARRTVDNLEAALAGAEPMSLRIAKYNLATALHELGEPGVEDILEELTNEYCKELDLSLDELFAVNLPELSRMLRSRSANADEVKRLADCLDFKAILQRQKGRPDPVLGMWAQKLFLMSMSYLSAVRVGQETVDDMLKIAPPDEARLFMEQTLIPIVKDLKMTGHLVPIKSQYSVVLALCGLHQEAAELQAELNTYAAALDESGRLELENQGRQVKQLARDGAPRFEKPRQVRRPPEKRIGRNQICPCGSGTKFKRCCGG